MGVELSMSLSILTILQYLCRSEISVDWELFPSQTPPLPRDPDESRPEEHNAGVEYSIFIYV